MFWGGLYFKKFEEFTTIRLCFLGVKGLNLCLRGYDVAFSNCIAKFGLNFKWR